MKARIRDGEETRNVLKAKPTAPRAKGAMPLDLSPELANAVGFGLRRAITKADELFAETFAPLEITTQQYAVMLSVRENPGCQPSALSSLLNITPNNLVPQIDSLVSRGFIRRSLSTRDRRIRHLRLTPTGERFADELVQRHNAVRLATEAKIGTENTRELVRLLALYARPAA
jgi:DNA-binding MarR family transcriptional regulator